MVSSFEAYACCYVVRAHVVYLEDMLGPQLLVLVPTFELGTQVRQHMASNVISSFLSSAVRTCLSETVHTHVDMQNQPGRDAPASVPFCCNVDCRWPCWCTKCLAATSAANGLATQQTCSLTAGLATSRSVARGPNLCRGVRPAALG